MTTLLNLKVWEIDVEATQKKFNDNWKIISGKNDNVNLNTFYDWKITIEEPLRQVESLRRRLTADNTKIRKEIKRIQETDEYKIALTFTTFDWDPVCSDIGKMIRALSDRVDTLEDELSSLRDKVRENRQD